MWAITRVPFPRGVLSLRKALVFGSRCFTSSAFGSAVGLKDTNISVQIVFDFDFNRALIPSLQNKTIVIFQLLSQIMKTQKISENKTWNRFHSNSEKCDNNNNFYIIIIFIIISIKMWLKWLSFQMRDRMSKTVSEMRRISSNSNGY